MADSDSPSIAGTLSLYPLPGGDQRPYFTSGDESSTRAVVFIGGLWGGFLSTPFLPSLSDALKEAGWRLVQIYWSGVYEGYGTGSLNRDADEMEALVQHLRSKGVSDIVLMGHSTGSQDVIHYLSSKREEVQGGIMVAPASDREFFERDPDAEWAAGLKKAKKLIEEGKPRETFMISGMRMSAYRMHSLVGRGGDDDYFSSDLPDAPDDSVHVHPLSTSFGRLSAPALALWCEGDHCGNGDQRPLLRRWEAAAQGKLTWRVLEGASHMVSEPGPQEDLNEQVLSFLARSGEGQPDPARA